MKLSREEIMTALKEWNHAWEKHDLDGVMKLYHNVRSRCARPNGELRVATRPISPTAR